MSASQQSSSKFRAFFLSIIVFLWLYLPVHSRPFTSRGEAREAVVVEDMIRQNNYILPRRNDEAYPSKPPLLHWTAVLGRNLITKITGVESEGFIRLPSALASATTCGIVYFIAATNIGPTAGIVAALGLLSTFEWLRYSTLGRVDLLFSLMIFLSLVCLARVLSNKDGCFADSAFLGLFLGFATLTKGPAAIVLIGVTALLDQSYQQRRIFPKFPVKHLSFAAFTALALALPWYYFAYKIGGEQFLDVQLMRENVARLTGDEGYNIGHRQAFYVAPLLFFLVLIPWVFYLPVFYTAAIKRTQIRIPQTTIFISYAIVLLTFCSIAASKRTVYFISALPGLVLIFADILTNTSFLNFNAGKFTKWIFNILTVTLGTLLIAICLGVLVPDLALKLLPLSDKLLRKTYTFIPILQFNSWAIIFLLLGCYCFFKARVNLANPLYMIFGCLAVISYAQVGPAQGYSELVSPAEFAQDISARINPHDSLVQYRLDYYPLVYYAKRPIPFLDTLPLLKDSYVIGIESTAAELTQAGCNLMTASEKLIFRGRERLGLYFCKGH
ncbi:glycosyltransferase family 39 protein [bacterium]|nr:glycosyltransferase family 39 protein [bacterium]